MAEGVARGVGVENGGVGVGNGGDIGGGIGVLYAAFGQIERGFSAANSPIGIMASKKIPRMIDIFLFLESLFQERAVEVFEGVSIISSELFG